MYIEITKGSLTGWRGHTFIDGDMTKLRVYNDGEEKEVSAKKRTFREIEAYFKAKHES